MPAFLTDEQMAQTQAPRSSSPSFLSDEEMSRAAPATPHFMSDEQMHAASAPKPQAMRDHPMTFGTPEFESAYKQQQMANAAGTGGGSPITPRELIASRQGPLENAYNAYTQGMVGGAIAHQAAAERFGKTPSDTSPTQMQDILEATHPTRPGLSATIGGAVAGLHKFAPAIIAPPLAPFVIAEQAGEGVGGAYLQAQQQREAGQPVSQGAADVAAAGRGAISGLAAGVRLPIAKAIGGALPIAPTLAGRLATQIPANMIEGAIAGPAIHGAENIVTRQTIQPDLPITQGMAQAAIGGALTQGAFGAAHALRSAPPRFMTDQQMHQAVQTPAPPEGAPNAVQEPGPAQVLQREPSSVGELGGQRQRVEQGQQGEEAAQAGPPQAEAVAPQAPARDPNIPNSLLGTDERGQPIRASQLRLVNREGGAPDAIAKTPEAEPAQPLAEQAPEKPGNAAEPAAAPSRIVLSQDIQGGKRKAGESADLIEQTKDGSAYVQFEDGRKSVLKPGMWKAATSEQPAQTTAAPPAVQEPAAKSPQEPAVGDRVDALDVNGNPVTGTLRRLSPTKAGIVDQETGAVRTVERSSLKPFSAVEKEPEPTPESKPLARGMGPASINDPIFTYGDAVTGIKNKTVDAERQTRGLEPAMAVAKRGFGEVWDSAMKEIDKHPSVQDELIGELRDKPRALTDREDALVLHRQIELQTEFSGEAEALSQAQAANDQIGVAEHRVKVAALSDKLLDIYNIGKTSGTETGRGLNARKMMAAEDFTLAAMETKKRAANEGKPLTPDQQVELKSQHDKIETVQKKLDEYQAAAENRKQLSLKRQIADLEQRIKDNQIAPKPGQPTADTKTVAELKSRRDELNKQLDALRGDQPALQAFKTRTAGRIDELQGKIENQDFSRPPARSELKLDPQATELKAQLERYKQQFQAGLLRDRLQNRSLPEKVQDTFVKWRRAFLLSSPVTLAKLTSAAAERMTFTPGEELIGAGLGKVFPGVSSRAPREGGGLNVRAEARAITDGFTTGMADAWKTLRTGKSDLDVLYGKQGTLPPSAIDFVGSLHGALKAPVKRNEFARSFQKRIESAMGAGLDATDPAVQTRAAVEAYKDANRSIFMQDNVVVDAYKRAVQALEQPNKATGKPSVGGKALATVAKTLLPIVKVPTNIVAETMQYALGTVSGGARLARAYGRGIEKLSPNEADLIMRSLKKGSVGAAVMLLGYLNADQVGGYYQPGKRDEKDVKFGGVRVFGHDVPSYLVHNPLLETLQIGATIRRVADSKLRKKDEDTQGITAGSMAAALGLIEEVPFVRETTEVAKVLDPRQRDRSLGQTAKSIVVPQAVSWAAQKMDTDAAGNPVQRKPEGLLQNIEMGIPGLRSNVPVKHDPVQERHDARQKAIDAIRSGTPITEALKEILPQERSEVMRQARRSDAENHIEHMDTDEAMSFYREQNPEDRAKMKTAMRRKIVGSRIHTPEQKRALLKSLD
jgi:hypothetical protein